MIVPIRCFSCGRPVGHLWEEFKKRTSEGENQKKILDDFELDRFCCRSVLLSQRDTIELVSNFKKA